MSLALIKSSGRKLFIMCNKAWSVQYWGRGGGVEGEREELLSPSPASL